MQWAKQACILNDRNPRTMCNLSYGFKQKEVLTQDKTSAQEFNPGLSHVLQGTNT